MINGVLTTYNTIKGYHSFPNFRKEEMKVRHGIYFILVLVGAVFIYLSATNQIGSGAPGRQEPAPSPSASPKMAKKKKAAKPSEAQNRIGASIADGRSDCEQLANGQVHCPNMEAR